MPEQTRARRQDPKDWLRASRMNLLVDYYPEVPFRPYGSGATRENVLPWLRQLNLGYLCVYAKGHSGYTTWPSSLRTQHVRLAQDMPRFFRDLTREAGTRLVLYYSGLLDGLAGTRHPEWRMQHPDGRDQRYFDDFPNFTSYGNCPHSRYWDDWAAVQLRELLEQYEPDGIWVDGDWPAPCHCARCRAEFRRFSGWAGRWDRLRARPDFAAEYERFWKHVTHTWRTRFNAFIKRLKPDCAYSAGNVSPRREYLAPFDWRSGDFFSPGSFSLHDIARMMRWYGTLGIPYDAYVCDTSFTHGRKQVRSRTKTLDRMLQEAATVAANGGAVGYWTYPLGNGALVPSRMRKAAATRRFLRAREDVLRDTRSLGWTAVLVTDPAAPTFGGAGVEGAHKALAALHRSPDVIDETGLAPDMPYDLIVLPEQPAIGPAAVRKLAAFVRRGGKLLTSGVSIRSAPLRRLLGVRAVKSAALNDGHVLLKSHDEPAGVDRAWDALAVREAEELYPLYLSWDQFNPQVGTLSNNWPMHGQLDEEHPEPAGMPAATARRLGKGLAAHIATDVFAQYRRLGDPQMLRWVRELADFLQPAPLLNTNAPCWVDVSLRRQGRDLLVHFVNQNPGRDAARLGSGTAHVNDDVWVDEIPAVGPYTCELRLRRKPSRLTWEPGGRPLGAAWRHGLLTLRVPRFRIHACLRIQSADWPPARAIRKRR